MQGGPAIRVLLVEDNQVDADLVADLLDFSEGASFEISTFARIGEAVAAIEAGETFHAAILDMNLPDGQGVDIVSRFLAAAGDVPAIVLTGTNDDQLGMEAVRAGAQDYLVKGFVDEHLLARSIRYAIERVEREHAQRLLTQELEHIRNYLNTLICSVQSTIVACAPDSRITTFSDPSGALWDRSVPPRYLDELAAVHKTFTCDEGQELALQERPLQRALKGETIHNLEIRQTGFDGRTRYFLTNAMPLSSGAENLGAVVSLQDITELKTIQTRLVQSQKMEAIGQLTGGVAHDFNNLLTVVLGNLELMERRLQDDPKLLRYLEAARKAGLQGAQLTRQLLAFGRNQILQASVVNLNDTVVEMESMLSRTLGETIALKTALRDGLPPTSVDRAQLESAVLNLVLNARDAMPNGGQLTIETSEESLSQTYATQHADVAAGRYTMIAVTDTGRGMAPDIAERVFEPFFTTKQVGKGTGLGLSMVFGFVKQSGGHIKVYSEPGVGTTFKLYFPVSGSLPAALQPEALQTVAAYDRRLNILVVEDDPDVREITVAMIEDLGHSVRTAANGPEALTLLEECIAGSDGIDLLFTDMVMPEGMSGKQLADRARELMPAIRVLFASGYTRQAMLRNGNLEEGHLLLSKPYDKTVLAEKIQEAFL